MLWRPCYSKCLTAFIILMGKENCLPTQQSCSFLSSSQPYLCGPYLHLQFGGVLLVHLLYLGFLAFVFNAVEGSLGLRGDRRLSVAVGSDIGGHLTLEKFLPPLVGSMRSLAA